MDNLGNSQLCHQNVSGLGKETESTTGFYPDFEMVSILKGSQPPPQLALIASLVGSLWRGPGLSEQGRLKLLLFNSSASTARPEGPRRMAPTAGALTAPSALWVNEVPASDFQFRIPTAIT